MSNGDQHHGQGGSYTVRDGKRELVKDSRTVDTGSGGARDKDGELLDAPSRDAKPEPALPAPQAMPWGAPAVPAPAAKEGGPQTPGKTERKGA